MLSHLGRHFEITMTKDKCEVPSKLKSLWDSVSHHRLIPSSSPSKMHISNWLSQADTSTSKVMPISDELRQVATNTSNLPCFKWHNVEPTTRDHNAPILPLGKARQVVKARQKCTKRIPLRADHMTNRHLRHTQEHVPHPKANTAMKLTCERQSLLRYTAARAWAAIFSCMT